MSSSAEEDLLRMSLSGSLPSSTASSFDAAKAAGNLAFRDARYHDAVRHYTSAEHINPLSPVPPANRAMAYLKLQNWSAAKADASVALELHNALPTEQHTHALPVKILLRRATANEHLMLYALAADDYAEAASRDPANQVATAKLNELNHRFGATPSPSIPPSAPQNHPRHKITLLSSSALAANHLTEGVPNPVSPDIPTSNLQDETALVDLPQNVMHGLVSRWSESAPASAFEFERAWKSLQVDQQARARYLLSTVGANRIRNGLLGETLTPQLLEDLVAVLAAALEDEPRNAPDVADVLQALTKVARFDMLLMFLSPAEKRPFESLLAELGKNGIAPQRVVTLKECYS